MDAAKVTEYKNKFIEKVGFDLNTSAGLTIVYDALKDGMNDATKRAVLADLDNVLSLDILKAADLKVEEENTKSAVEIPAEDAWIVEKINERAQAKKDKDYARADAIRAELASQGITLVDTKDGTTYTKA